MGRKSAKKKCRKRNMSGKSSLKSAKKEKWEEKVHNKET